MYINRLFEIVYILLSKKSITAKELAERFEVSQRTIYRDVDLLSSANIPIYATKGKGGGISLLPDFVLNKTVFSEEEKTDIISAMQALNAVNMENNGNSLEKLSAFFGAERTNWVEVNFSKWSNYEDETELFLSLKKSILAKERIEFLYHSVENRTNRKVEPIKLVFKGQDWYLYAFCLLREDFRFFKLRRIKKLKMLEENFDRIAPANVLGTEKVFNDDFVLISMKMANEMAYRVYDEFQEYEILPDGGFIVQISIPRGDWIYQYIATFGEFCEVISPVDIRNQVKTKLQKTLEKYL